MTKKVQRLITIGFLGTNSAYAAYDRYGAAAYADQYAVNPNTGSYPYWSGVDCTNFVSQALHQGGTIPFDTTGSTEAFKWYIYDHWYGWEYVKPWSMASFMYNWMRDDGHGNYIGRWDPISGTGYPYPYDTVSGTQTGDVTFYDWDNNGAKDHAGIIVGWGTDPNPASGLTGDITDQHSTNRYHSIWHLRPYNSDWMTTAIYVRRPV